LDRYNFVPTDRTKVAGFRGRHPVTYKIKIDGNKLVNLGVDWRIIKFILKEKGSRLWTGFIWLRIGTSGGLL
jgi:hypothetical protein